MRLLLMLAGCAAGSADHDPAVATVLHGGIVVGRGPADVRIEGARITAVGEVDLDGAEVVDVTGRWIAPGFIDSHVHLAYRPEPDAMADGGVVAAVDWAAPIGFLADLPDALDLVASGPMITAVGGYPTQSWGAGGYGLECADADAAVLAVDTLHDAGARVIKLPVTGAPVLDEAALTAAAARARELGLPTGSHALSDAHAATAGRAGIEVLVHTPTEPLSDATLALWQGRTVISTMRAFGSSDATIENLRALRARGAIVLYGSDYGNTSTAGIDERELDLLLAAGLDGAAVLEAGTAAPAARWGLTEVGAVAPGRIASLLVLEDDPITTPSTLARARQVWIRGRRR